MRERSFVVQLVLIGLLATIFSVLSARAQSADPVDATVSVSDGYARFKFEWAQEPKYTAEIENGVLILNVDRPFNIDLTDLAAPAFDYVALIRQDRDQTTLRFALKQNLRLQISGFDSLLAIDLVPTSYEGLPQRIVAPPEPVSVAAEVDEEEETGGDPDNASGIANEIPKSVPKLPVHVSESDSVSRVIFEWPEPVGYDVRKENDQIIATFNKLMRPKLSRLRVDPPVNVLSAKAMERNGGLEVRIDVEPGTDFHSFRDGNKTVIDIVVKQTNLAALADDDEHTSANDPHAADPHVDQDGHGSQDRPSETQAPNEHVDEARTDHALAADTHAIVASGEDTHEEIIVAEEIHAEETHEVATDVARAVPVHDAPGVVEEDETKVHKPRKKVPPKHIKVVAADSYKGLTMTFPWGVDVPATIFRRGDFVWIVFEVDGSIDSSNVHPNEYSEITTIEDIRRAGLAIMRLGVSSRMLVSAKATVGRWVVSLTESIDQPPVSLQLVRHVAEDTSSEVHIEFPAASRVHWIEDPEIGDTFAVVPGRGPARGIITPRRHMAFSALPTAHGLLVEPYIDDIEIKVIDGIVRILERAGPQFSQGSGLYVAEKPASHLAKRPRRPTATVSDHSAEQSKPEPTSDTGHGASRVEPELEPKAEPEPALPGFMDFETWSRGGEEHYFTNLYTLNEALSDASDGELDERRLDLARFYLGHGLHAEALGNLGLIEERNDELSSSPTFLVTLGVTNFLMNRPEKAVEILSHRVLGKDPNTSLWLGMAHEQIGDFEEARRRFQMGERALNGYSDDVRKTIQFSEIRSAIGVNDMMVARRMLEQLDVDGLTDRQNAEQYFLHGQMFDGLGEHALALEYFRQAEAAYDEEVTAKARFLMVNLQHRTGELETKQAIHVLDRLRYQWRGGQLELEILEQLGELHESIGRYRDALTIWETAATNFYGEDRTRAIGLRMMDLFERLYLNGEADGMSPVAAVSLYYDFKHLTPIGAKGDTIARRLSDRLVKVDLLSKAAELLDHQVRNRLRGVARSQVATKLAVVYLMNKEPDKALNILYMTRQVRLPQGLAQDRQLLEARALTELGRYEHALDILEDEVNLKARRLRADIYWDASDWGNAAKHIEELVDEKWDIETELSTQTRQDIMRAAISYAFAQDSAGLVDVRRKYKDRMAESPDAAAFNVVTDAADVQAIEFRSLARQIATIDTLEAFMSDFRERYNGKGSQGF